MNAKDLMIGDWVRITRSQWHEGSTQKVLDVYENGSIRTKHISPVLEDSYEPVLLTPEILETNCFRKEEFEYGEVGWFPKEGCTYLTQYPHQNPMFALEGTDIKLEYVHQLQHALRLYGLRDLADNLKI